jgi:hypothetical protein
MQPTTTSRGYGAGPNGGGGFKRPPQGTYVGDIQLGLFQVIDTPDTRQLAAYTRQVKADTLREVAVVDHPANPVPAAIGLRRSPIRHIVYITKENRTFDDVFGQFQGANGDPTIARLGRVDLRALNGCGKEPFPQFISIQIPNDHLADTREDDGYPYRESFMADNDLALGRILQFLSHTPYWKEMAVIIVEDDPQGGVDHVDAHRSILMMAGPWIKQGCVSHTHANFGAVLKTMYRILDLPPVNQFDAAANLLSDFFTEGAPDFTPYEALPVDPRVFDPTVAMKKFGQHFDWREIKGGEPMDDEDDQRRSHDSQKEPD